MFKNVFSKQKSFEMRANIDICNLTILMLTTKQIPWQKKPAIAVKHAFVLISQPFQTVPAQNEISTFPQLKARKIGRFVEKFYDQSRPRRTHTNSVSCSKRDITKINRGTRAIPPVKLGTTRPFT